MQKNPFEIIKGGKESDEPDLTGEERRGALREDILKQRKLTETERMKLKERLKKELLLNIKFSALKLKGKILTDEEANFINDRIARLIQDDSAVKKELQEKFPDLVDYFEKILENLEKVDHYLFDLSPEEIRYINRQEEWFEKIKSAESIVDFDNLDFGKMDGAWKEIVSSTEQEEFSPEKNYSFYKKINWKGQELFLSALKTMQLSEKGILLENVKFQLGLRRSLVRAKEGGLILDSQGEPNIEFCLVTNHLDKPYPSVETLIVKNDPDKKMPLKMTALIYKKIFEYIQGQANENKISYQHRIKKKTSISDQDPLSDEKWKEIFLPIIKNNGYKQFSSATWTKEYEPKLGVDRF